VPLSLPLKFPVIKSSRPDESFHQVWFYPPFEQWEHLIVAIFVIKHIVFLHHCFSLLFENLPLALHFSRYSFAAKVASFLRFLFEIWYKRFYFFLFSRFILLLFDIFLLHIKLLNIDQ